MSHAFLFVSAAGQTEAPSFHKGVRALGDFKGVQITDSSTSATASLAVAPAVVLLIAVGFFPQLMLNDINPAVDRTMVSIGQTDPEPKVDAATVGEAR